jgi:hypothetical protein
MELGLKYAAATMGLLDSPKFQHLCHRDCPLIECPCETRFPIEISQFPRVQADRDYLEAQIIGDEVPDLMHE